MIIRKVVRKLLGGLQMAERKVGTQLELLRMCRGAGYIAGLPVAAATTRSGQNIKGGITMAKTQKIIDVCADGTHIVVIRINDRAERNQYRIYKHVDRYHRRQIAKYGDFMSVLYYLTQFYRDGMDRATMPELIEWGKSNGSIFWN